MLMMVLITACNSDGSWFPQGPAGVDGGPGQVVTVPVVPPQESDIQALVDDENAYRLGLGQTLLSPGLSCILYTFTSGDRIQSSISGHNTLTGLVQVASYTYKGVFNQSDTSTSNGMNVLPPALQAIYQNLYLLRCQGQIVIQNDDFYAFSVTSDDGSVFYLDNAKLIDLDNAHGSQTLAQQKYLRRGVHVFRIDYSQSGAGNESLVIQSAQGTNALSVVDSTVLFH